MVEAATKVKRDALQALPDAASWSAEQVLRWSVDTYGRKVALSSSFQADGMVVLDISRRLGLDLRVITVDTGRLPPETHELIDEVRERYGVEIETQFPDQAELSDLVTKFGTNPFYRSVSLRLRCCEIRKSHPVDAALGELDAWITGLRRNQTETRQNIDKIEIDDAHGGIVKLNPLADWDDAAVWDYIKANEVPYNRLYDMGYTSIGCAPCTRPVEPGEDARAGRWWWESGVPKECGIHMSPAWARAIKNASEDSDVSAREPR